jgi:hypothetical protein
VGEGYFQTHELTTHFMTTIFCRDQMYANHFALASLNNATCPGLDHVVIGISTEKILRPLLKNYKITVNIDCQDIFDHSLFSGEFHGGWKLEGLEYQDMSPLLGRMLNWMCVIELLKYWALCSTHGREKVGQEPLRAMGISGNGPDFLWLPGS